MEMLVRIKDKVSDDFYINCQLTKRGDVIVVRPDGHNWAKEELANPEWRILKFPNVPIEEGYAFLMSEMDTDPSQPSKTLQRRSHKIDLDDPSFPQEIKVSLDSKERIDPAPLALATNDLRAFKVAKQPIPDPAVIRNSL